MYKNGEIARLYFLKFGGVQQTFKEIFCPDFRDPTVLKGFLGSKIKDSIEGNLNRWSVGHFQAYFMLCWLHHPSEKGSYMIDLRNANVPKMESVIKENLIKRSYWPVPGSSHFSREGYSARQGWGFLNHYNELLVQLEEIRGRPFLFLKAEGHTTHGFDAIQHCVSLIVKRAPSKELTAIADDTFVAKRVAENFSSGYKTFLSKLNLKGKFITVLEMVQTLYDRLRAENTGVAKTELPKTISDEQLSDELKKVLKLDMEHRILEKIGLDREEVEEVRKDLEKIAGLLETTTPDLAFSRVFCEVQVTPRDLESTYNNVMRIMDENLRSSAAA